MYRQRGDRGTAGARVYIVYLATLIALLYGLPIAYTTWRQLPQWSNYLQSVPVLELGYAGSAIGVLLALIVGRWWGPMITPPLVLAVLGSTDIPAQEFLQPVVRRRMLVLAAAVGVPAAGVAFALAVQADHRAFAVLASVSVLMAVWAALSAWLWGQAASMRAVIIAAVSMLLLLGIGCAGAISGVIHVLPALALLVDSSTSPSTHSIVIGLVIQAVVSGVAWWVAWQAIRLVDMRRLANESARASSAHAYVATGTFHDALDLFRPEPSGMVQAMTDPHGRLRSHFRQGAVRALRTPGRSIVGAGCLIAGSVGVHVGVSGTVDSQFSMAPVVWVVGAIAVYLGAGWISESWRSLRDELSLPKILGEAWGGPWSRHLPWPSIFIGSALAAGGVASIQLDAGIWALAAATQAMAFSARFLREMKLLLPVELMTPISTPFGDLSGLRVVAWQFDSLILITLGVVGLSEIDSTPGRLLVVVSVTAWCWWKGLERVGWSASSVFEGIRSSRRDR